MQGLRIFLRDQSVEIDGAAHRVLLTERPGLIPSPNAFAVSGVGVQFVRAETVDRVAHIKALTARSEKPADRFIIACPDEQKHRDSGADDQSGAHAASSHAFASPSISGPTLAHTCAW